MTVIEVYSERFGWCVQPQGGPPVARLATLAQAEGRARWLATSTPITRPEPKIRVLPPEPEPEPEPGPGGGEPAGAMSLGPWAS